MRLLSRRKAVGYVAVAICAGLALPIGASAAKSKTKSKNAISVHGPTKNLYHTYFNETVSGYATGSANYVISGEQLYPAGGCAKTYVKESHKTDWGVWGTTPSRPGGTGPVHGHFSLVARFWARNHSEHGICSYLINSSTKSTYAHASRWWNNS